MKSIKTPPLDLPQSQELARLIANHLQEKDVIALSGELGTGKTTFVSHVASHLDLQPGHHVTSPTYVIHHTYEAKFPIHHIDLYRLEHPSQIENLGFEEFLGIKGIAMIEWFEKFPKIYDGDVILIRIEFVDEQTRVYFFDFPDHFSANRRGFINAISTFFPCVSGRKN